MSSNYRSKNQKPARRAAPRAGKARSSAPVATATRRVVGKPQMRTSADSMRVRHTEFLKDVSGSSSFSVESLAVNPGLPSLFPWLSRIASRYERYKFHNLAFHFETSTATSSTGTLMGVLDYDASDAAPPNKTQLMSQSGAVRSAPWQDVTCRADPKRMSLSRFVRVGSAPAGTDVKLYDVGNYLLSVQGQSGSDIIGELYVEYDVELMIATSEAQCPGGKITAGGTISNAAIFGDDASYAGPVPCTASGSTLTFAQPGEFLISLLATGTTLITIPAPSGTAVSSRQQQSGSGTTWVLVCKVRAEAGDTMVYDLSGAAAVSAAVLEIASGPYDSL